jgi:hypothetical protein
LRGSIRIISAVLLIVLTVLSCGKKKTTTPTRPEDQGNAVTLQYQSYYIHLGYGWGCVRLTLDDVPIDLCGLGTRAASFWTRDYHWRLFLIDTRYQPETYIPVQEGTVSVNRNITCLVDHNTVTWR